MYCRLNSLDLITFLNRLIRGVNYQSTASRWPHRPTLQSISSQNYPATALFELLGSTLRITPTHVINPPLGLVQFLHSTVYRCLLSPMSGPFFPACYLISLARPPSKCHALTSLFSLTVRDGGADELRATERRAGLSLFSIHSECSRFDTGVMNMEATFHRGPPKA